MDQFPSVPAWRRSRIRVPREDGKVLAIPPLADVPELVDANSTLLSESVLAVAGRSLSSFRNDTRRESLAAAADFTARLARTTPEFRQSDRVLASGHQPELFHPGVWIKNFAVSKLAQATGSTGLNLIVDSDTIGSCRIRVPGGTRQRPVFEHLAFDRPRDVMPWEEARVRDRELLETFSDRAVTALARFGESDSARSPLISRVWPKVVEHAASTGSLSESLSLARILLERELGYGNLELPVSQLCRLDSFLWFAADVLLRAEEFREVQNRTLAEYRKVNRIRSRTHPVPELTESSGWIEAPFRIWREGETQRQPVFVRVADERRQLSGTAGEEGIFLDVAARVDCESLTRELSQLAGNGIRFRTRALTTTIFTRLCLADLFVHGIGGARYDEMTDRILARFYGIRPPGFLTLSATAWLPFASPHPDTPADATRLRTMLRELQHNPQKHLPADQTASAEPLVREKQRLIDQQHAAESRRLSGSKPTGRDGVDRYRRIPQINRELAALTTARQNAIREELALVEQRLASNAVLKCREFSFCLYPAERIEKMLADLETRL